MAHPKKEIIDQLQKEILVLQGFKTMPVGNAIDPGLGSITRSFPNNSFPVAAVHEFISNGMEASAATSGFITALLAGLMQDGKACVWISGSRTLFPSGVKNFWCPARSNHFY